MEERCCRVRRCGLASLAMIRAMNRAMIRVVSLVVKAVVIVVGIEVVIAGGDVMSSEVGVDARRLVMQRLVLSTVRLRHGWIRRRLCFLR